MLPGCAEVACASGIHGKHLNQNRTAFGWIRDAGKTPKALAATKAGQPKHALFLPGDLQPDAYNLRTPRTN